MTLNPSIVHVFTQSVQQSKSVSSAFWGAPYDKDDYVQIDAYNNVSRNSSAVATASLQKALTLIMSDIPTVRCVF